MDVYIYTLGHRPHTNGLDYRRVSLTKPNSLGRSNSARFTRHGNTPFTSVIGDINPRTRPSLLDLDIRGMKRSKSDRFKFARPQWKPPGSPNSQTSNQVCLQSFPVSQLQFASNLCQWFSDLDCKSCCLLRRWNWYYEIQSRTVVVNSLSICLLPQCIVWRAVFGSAKDSSVIMQPTLVLQKVDDFRPPRLSQICNLGIIISLPKPLYSASFTSMALSCLRLSDCGREIHNIAYWCE